MRRRLIVLILSAIALCSLSAQSGDWTDADAALQYAEWARQAIAENRWSEALAGLERAMDYADESSDIPYMLAIVYIHEKKSRFDAIELLDRAVDTKRFFFYSDKDALFQKARQLCAIQQYSAALKIIETLPKNADSAALKLASLYGYMRDNPEQIQIPALFRAGVLETMDRYPYDPRPFGIFFEYARNRNILNKPAEGDMELLQLVMRRLPFLLESDPELAWQAALFTRDPEDARRLLSSYRAGSITKNKIENFKPHPASVAAALNLGLIYDRDAADELFESADRLVDKDILIDVSNLLRSEDGRDYFSRKLMNFSGVIFSGKDDDGYAQSKALYGEGIISQIEYDYKTTGLYDLKIDFDPGGNPVKAETRPSGGKKTAFVVWDRYPSVRQITFDSETFLFKPADFQFAPLTFTELAAINGRSGILYPEPQYLTSELTRRSLVSFCASIKRPSVEFQDAEEEIFFSRGFPVLSVETRDGRQLSFTEYRNGVPVLQCLDFDHDGRMETLRTFRAPGPDFAETFYLLDLIASSESDWTGEGKYRTQEVYLPDGSVVFSLDIDGSGVLSSLKE
ncbi:MAG: tetratricopeptide repeat protein [Treponema sp.]|jgi:hypothetical protein|nr:tetratricopeptide repeat protein [Treponema sp.]